MLQLYARCIFMNETYLVTVRDVDRDYLFAIFNPGLIILTM